ncbi:MAG: amidohydrolase [Microbacterium gubbeenense]
MPDVPALSVSSRVDVIANARIGGEGRELLAHPDVEKDGLVDLWISGGRISDIAPAGNLRHRGTVLDAEGAWVVPGLRDHHVHALQAALFQDRASIGHAAGASEAARVAASVPVEQSGRRVLVGMRHAFWSDLPTLDALDEATGEVPTYIVNADLHSIWMNSAAFRREQIAPDPSGLVSEHAAFDVANTLNDVDAADADAALERAAARSAARGLVAFSDLEMGGQTDAWRRRGAAGWNLLRVASAVYPEHLDRVVAEGLETGDRLDESGLITVGALKFVGDGSLGTRTAATTAPYLDGERGAMNFELDRLVATITRAAGSGLASTVHAIGDIAVATALDAFALAGVPGRMEHAQLVAASDIPRFARLGIEASVQPQHALDDRDLTDSLWAGQTATPYPLRALSDAGANLLFGSDAPVSTLDPWVQIAAAVARTDDDRAAWQPEQAVDARTALAASTGGGSADPQVIEPGAVADLAIIAVDPLAASADQLRAMPVHATLLAGRVTHIS